MSAAKQAGALLAALAVAAVILLAGGAGTLAAFTDPATVRAGTAAAPDSAFTSGRIATPATPTTSAPSSGPVQLSWSATAAGLGTADRYEILRYTSASGGTPAIVCTTTALTCTEAGPVAGQVWYAVRARMGDNWTNEGARIAYAPSTATPPAVVIPVPLGGCSGSVACGTASSASGIASVEYILRRTLSGGVAQCWDPVLRWQSAGTATCAYRPASYYAPDWTIPGPPGQGIKYPATYVLTVRVTDNLGNQTIQSATTTI